MAHYDQPVHKLMKAMAAELAPTSDATFTRQQALSWFATTYPKIKPATVAAHLSRLSTNAPCRVHYRAKPGDDDVLYQIDSTHYRTYRPGYDPMPLTAANPPEEPEDTTAAGAASAFAYETDLRNYLAKNLTTLEAGLRLYEDEDGITGMEFPAGGRYIDLLAVDAADRLVVIELKVSRAYDRVIGQLLRYIAWIRTHLAEPEQPVRGIIVARTMSEDLVLACSELPDVTLVEYALALTFTPITP